MICYTETERCNEVSLTSPMIIMPAHLRTHTGPNVKGRWVPFQRKRTFWTDGILHRNKTTKWNDTFLTNEHRAGLSAPQLGYRGYDHRLQRHTLSADMLLTFLRWTVNAQLNLLLGGKETEEGRCGCTELYAPIYAKVRYTLSINVMVH